MLQTNNGSYKYNYVMLTHYWVQFNDVPLYTLYVVTCIEISSSEVFDPKWSIPYKTLSDTEQIPLLNQKSCEIPLEISHDNSLRQASYCTKNHPVFLGNVCDPIFETLLMPQNQVK